MLDRIQITKEVEENMQTIIEKYENILNTEGKKEIQKI